MPLRNESRIYHARICILILGNLCLIPYTLQRTPFYINLMYPKRDSLVTSSTLFLIIKSIHTIHSILWDSFIFVINTNRQYIMKKLTNPIMIVLSILFIAGCGWIYIHPSRTKDYHDPIIQATVDHTSSEIENYMESSISELEVRLDKESGFLGWKDIRDLLGYDSTPMEKRVKKEWRKVYKPRITEKILKKNLEKMYILKGANPKEITVKKRQRYNEAVGQYAYRTVIGWFGEFILEFAEFITTLTFGSLTISILVFLYTFYQFSIGGWIRWSKRRKAKVDSIGEKIQVYSKWVIAAAFLIYSLLNENPSSIRLRAKVIDDIQQEIIEQIDINVKQLQQT